MQPGADVSPIITTMHSRSAPHRSLAEVPAATQGDNMEKPSLSTLPVETLEEICDFVENTRELKSLRLVSREFRMKTLNVFAKRQFTHLTVCLSEKDLENLVAISSHQTFAKVVRTLRVQPSYLDEVFDEEMLEKHGAQIGNPRQLKLAKLFHRDIIARQLAWTQSDDEAEMLAEALQGTTGLVRLDVGFEDSEAASKATEPLTGQLKNERHGIRGEDDARRNSTSHGFRVVLAALNQTKVGIKELCVGSDRYTIETGVLQLPQPYTLGLRECLRNLTVLSLGLDADTTAMDYDDEPHGDTRLANFLSFTTEVHSLSLYFERDGKDDYYKELSVFDFVADSMFRSVQNVFDLIRLPKLRKLKLDRACIAAKHLVDFLRNHQGHIESLELSSLCALDMKDPQDIPFMPALGNLLSECPKLESLSLSQITTQRGCMLFGQNDVDCGYCASPHISGAACAHSVLEVSSNILQSPATLERLVRSTAKQWVE